MLWKFGLSVPLILLISIVLYGYYLPEERSLTKVYRFQSSGDKVWETVRKIENQTKWRTDITEVKILSKDPETWKERTVTGNEMTFATVELKEKSLWTMKILEPTYLQANWTGMFQEYEGGTEVRFRESVRVQNPFYRILSFLFFDIDKTMNLYIQNLSQYLGETYEEKNLRTSVE